MCCHCGLHLSPELLLKTLMNVVSLVDGAKVLEVRCLMESEIITL